MSEKTDCVSFIIEHKKMTDIEQLREYYTYLLRVKRLCEQTKEEQKKHKLMFNLYKLLSGQHRLSFKGCALPGTMKRVKRLLDNNG